MYPPTYTSQAVWITSIHLSTGCSPYKDTPSSGGAGAPSTTRGCAAPCNPPMTASGRNPAWGCTYTPGGLLFLFSWGHTYVLRGSCLLASRPFCQGEVWGHLWSGQLGCCWWTPAPVLKVPVFTLGKTALRSGLNLTDLLYRSHFCPVIICSLCIWTD